MKQNNFSQYHRKIPAKVDFQRWMAIGEEYLRQGLSIIPIGLEKKPLVQWKQYQGRRPTTEEVKTWCRMSNFQGFGVVTGSISGLFVLDIDNGADIEDLILPSTPTAQTGSGGKHCYFKYPQDFSIKNCANILPHVDIRGAGGYAVLPPAKHPSGVNYSWITDLSTPMAEMPQWLKDRLTKQSAVPKFNPQLLQGVPKHQRNDSASRVIGKLLRHLPPHEWETTGWPLIESWNQRNNPPLSQIELREVYNSIASRESGRRLNVPFYNSFPPRLPLGVLLAETNFEPKIQSWEDYMAESSPQKGKWLIQDILRPGWLAVLGGHGKHGKSTLALHLLNSFRTGGKFINDCAPAPVIYVNYEMATEDVREMLQVITEYSSVRGEPAMIVSQPPVTPAGGGLEWLGGMLEKQEKHGVLVLDSFRAAFMLAGDTENHPGTVGGILRRLQTIARKTNWAIVVIHHFRKSGTGEPFDLSGSSEWTSAPDVIFAWNCPNWKEPGKLTILGRVPPRDPLSVRVSREKLEFLGTVADQAAEGERQKVLDFLSSERDITGEEVAKQVGGSEGTVRRCLAKLLDENLVTRTGKGRKGDPFLWRLPSSIIKTHSESIAAKDRAEQGRLPSKYMVSVDELNPFERYYTQPGVIEKFERELVL